MYGACMHDAIIYVYRRLTGTPGWLTTTARMQQQAVA
jgi:hypothetical protein